jgi:hypothetical protein
MHGRSDAQFCLAGNEEVASFGRSKPKRQRTARRLMRTSLDPRELEDGIGPSSILRTFSGDPCSRMISDRARSVEAWAR